MHRKLYLLMAALPAAVFAQTPVIGLGNFAHTADSLDKTVPFYRDVLGLPVSGAGDPLSQKPQPLDADLSRFTNTQGASFREATFRVPGANFQFELTEFSGTARKADRFAIQDPGSATLALTVRDIAAVMARAKSAGVTIVTTGAFR